MAAPKVCDIGHQNGHHQPVVRTEVNGVFAISPMGLLHMPNRKSVISNLELHRGLDHQAREKLLEVDDRGTTIRELIRHPNRGTPVSAMTFVPLRSASV